MSGALIGNYRVVKQIGAGGMASVCLAVHQDVPSLQVVLKKLGDPEMVERFKREADKLAKLDGHPGICQIKHFFDHDGDFYIAMEYIDGVTLQDHVDKQGPLELGQALFWARTILDVLETTHRLGICHRDIKPTNIMIDRHGNLKIIDFGLAKSDTDPHLTSVGTSLGSPLYMAPEQFNPREDCDWIRCDIYAVGICLYFMLTGRLPFGGANILQIMEAKTRGEVPWPSTLNPDIPPGLEATILQTLARDPQERFATAAEMKVALVSGPASWTPKPPPRATSSQAGAATVAMEAARLSGRSSGVRTAAGPGGGSRPGSAWTRHRRWLIPAGLAVAAGLSLVIAPGIFFPDREGPPADPAVPAEQENLAAGSSEAVPVDSTRNLAEKEAVSDLATRPADVRAQRDARPQETERAVVSPPAGARPDQGGSARTGEAPAAATGDLRVGSQPQWNADIYIDGDKTKYTTPATLTLPAGEYLVRVVLVTNGVTMQREEKVVVKAGELQKKIFTFD